MPQRHEFLPWDSAFFGQRFARVPERRLTPALLAELDAEMAADKIACAYFLCDASEAASIALAEQHRFHLADIRLTLEITLDAKHPAPLAVVADRKLRRLEQPTPEQIETLKAIARISHRATRFYHDGHFPSAQCDELYATWIEKSCRNESEAVFVIELAGTLVGYVTCQLDGPAAGKIGLLAVAERARRLGAGNALVQAALSWLADRQRRHVTVVTQGRSLAAQRLYQRSGFINRSVELWYHYWP